MSHGAVLLYLCPRQGKLGSAKMRKSVSNFHEVNICFGCNERAIASSHPLGVSKYSHRGEHKIAFIFQIIAISEIKNWSQLTVSWIYDVSIIIFIYLLFFFFYFGCLVSWVSFQTCIQARYFSSLSERLDVFFAKFPLIFWTIGIHN